MNTGKAKFEIGKIYRGTSGVGHISIEVIKRTEKTIVIKTSFGENRVKINDYYKNAEGASFKSWAFDATDIYEEEQQVQDAYSAAYHS